MKLALGVEYLGTNFHGWQLQKSGIRTVQQVVEEALSSIADKPIRVFCSGRTDAGVHALAQIAHFDLEKKSTEYTIKSALNFYRQDKKLSILILKLIIVC